MSIVETEILQYLIINDFELVYDEFGIYLGIKGGNGALLTAETMQELKHISQHTWLQHTNAITNL